MHFLDLVLGIHLQTIQVHLRGLEEQATCDRPQREAAGVAQSQLKRREEDDSF